MFQKLMRQFEYNLARKLFRLEPVSAPVSTAPSNVIEGRGDMIDLNRSSSTSSSATQTGLPAVASAKAGRNDPCPCGSGKKYKKCCYPKYG